MWEVCTRASLLCAATTSGKKNDTKKNHSQLRFAAACACCSSGTKFLLRRFIEWCDDFAMQRQVTYQRYVGLADCCAAGVGRAPCKVLWAPAAPARGKPLECISGACAGFVIGVRAAGLRKSGAGGRAAGAGAGTSGRAAGAGGRAAGAGGANDMPDNGVAPVPCKGCGLRFAGEDASSLPAKSRICTLWLSTSCRSAFSNSSCSLGVRSS